MPAFVKCSVSRFASKLLLGKQAGFMQKNFKNTEVLHVLVSEWNCFKISETHSIKPKFTFFCSVFGHSPSLKKNKF